MQFVNPLMLWGLAAASVPIVIHLLNRRRFRRQRWAAMEWLLRAARQNQKRLRVHNLLLLLLRTLAVILLALAIARPTLSNSPLAPVSTTRSHLFVLLDNSASMGARAGTRAAFDEAVAIVNALISEIGSDDPVTLVLTNDNSDPQNADGRPRVFEANRNHAKLRSLLGELRPAAARADLLDSLKLLEDAVPRSGETVPKVALVTDLQEVTITGALGGETKSAESDVRTILERLRDKGAEVLLIPVGRPTDNIGVVSLGPDEERDVIQGNPVRFVAGVANYGDREQRVEVRFLVDGKMQGDSGVWLTLPARPAGPEPPPTAQAQFDTRFESSEPSFHTIEARVNTDALPVDDVRSYAFEVRPPVQILVVDGDPSPIEAWRRPETYWLTPTLALEEDGPFRVTTVDESGFQALRDLSGYDLVMLANVVRPAPSDEARDRLEQFVSRGGALFMSLGDHVVSDVWNDEIYHDGNGLLPARLGSRYFDKDQPVLLDLGENPHPILRDVTDPGMSTFFTPPYMTGFVRLENLAAESAVKVVLTFADLARSPALVEKRFGSGRVLLLTTTVDEDWGKLCGASAFPVLLHECVYYVTTRGQASNNLLTYQPYRRSFPANFAAPFEITLPDGTPLQVEPDVRPDEAPGIRFGRTDQAGVYHTVTRFKPDGVLTQAPPPREGGFAVTLSPLESDLRRMPVDEAKARWRGLVTLADTFDGATEAVKARGGEISSHLLIAAILCLLGEALLARRIGAMRTQAA